MAAGFGDARQRALEGLYQRGHGKMSEILIPSPSPTLYCMQTAATGAEINDEVDGAHAQLVAQRDFPFTAPNSILPRHAYRISLNFIKLHARMPDYFIDAI